MLKERWKRLAGWWWDVRTRSRRREAALSEMMQRHQATIENVRALRARNRQLEAEIERGFANAGQPGLSPAEIERLAILSECCGQVVQAVGKVSRFGWQSQSPYGGKTNLVALEREIGNLRAIVTLMIDCKDVRLGDVQSWQKAKKAALEKWTIYQECSMPREEQLAMMDAIEQGAMR